MRTAAFALLACLGLQLATPAAAQDFPWQGFAEQHAMTNLMLEPLRRYSRENDAPAIGQRPSRGKAEAPARTAPPVADVTYRPSPQVSARVHRQFSAFVARQNGAPDARAVEEELRRADLLNVWSRTWAPDGLRQGNLLDAQVSYFITNWAIANGMEATTVAQSRGVREQFQPVMTANPTLARLGNDQRQEMAEIMMLNGTVQMLVYAAAKQAGNQDMVARLGDAAAQRFRSEAGVDLRRLTLTDRGFAPR